MAKDDLFESSSERPNSKKSASKNLFGKYFMSFYSLNFCITIHLEINKKSYAFAKYVKMES